MYHVPLQMKIVATLLSLSVCHGLYIYPQNPLFHSAAQPWVVRGLPIAGIVIDLPTSTEFVCPKDGTFPNLENACESYYTCSNGKVGSLAVAVHIYYLSYIALRSGRLPATPAFYSTEALASVTGPRR